MRTKVREPFKYRIVVRYSPEDQGYVADVPELRGCSAWGESEAEALEALMEAAKAWLEAAKANKIPIPTPIDEKRVSGKFPLRMPPELYKELAFEAKTERRSLNSYIVNKLSRVKR